jgi:hypothetical protein
VKSCFPPSAEDAEDCPALLELAVVAVLAELADCAGLLVVFVVMVVLAVLLAVPVDEQADAKASAALKTPAVKMFFKSYLRILCWFVKLEDCRPAPKGKQIERVPLGQRLLNHL